jgi:hypothetical protein
MCLLVALAATALAIGLAACGDDVEVARGESTVEPVETETAGADATADAASSTAVPTTTPATTATAVTVTEATRTDAECTAGRRTLEVAIEAFHAMNGAIPATEAELVEADILRDEIATHDFDPATGEVFQAPGADCAPPATAPDASVAGADPVTAESIYADLEASGTVEAVGGPECARELAEIGAAGFRFVEREGRDPESLEELASDLDVEVELWLYDAEDETLLAAPGSGCIDLEQATAPDPVELCAADRNTMEVAVEAYVAQFGGAALPDEADLVGAGLHRQEADT